MSSGENETAIFILAHSWAQRGLFHPWLLVHVHSAFWICSALLHFAQTLRGRSYNGVRNKNHTDTGTSTCDLGCVALGQWSSPRGDSAPPTRDIWPYLKTVLVVAFREGGATG